MAVNLTVPYSDDRLCEIIASRPDAATSLYRIVSRGADLGASLTETMREARRLYEITPWPDGRRQSANERKRRHRANKRRQPATVAQRIGREAYHLSNGLLSRVS